MDGSAGDSSSGSGDPGERRQFARIRTEDVVAVERLGSWSALAQSVDLSTAGIRFQCLGHEDIRPGEDLRIALRLGSDALSLVGTVHRVEKLDDVSAEVTLCLDALDAETHDAISRYLLDTAFERDPTFDQEP